jgi:hypothetical protein
VHSRDYNAPAEGVLTTILATAAEGGQQRAEERAEAPGAEGQVCDGAVGGPASFILAVLHRRALSVLLHLVPCACAGMEAYSSIHTALCC